MGKTNDSFGRAVQCPCLVIEVTDLFQFAKLLCPRLEAAFDHSAHLQKLSNKYTFQYPQSSFSLPSPHTDKFFKIQHFLSDAFLGNIPLKNSFQIFSLLNACGSNRRVQKPVDRNCYLFVDCCSSNMDKYCPNDVLSHPPL